MSEKVPSFEGISFWFVPKKLVKTQRQIMEQKIKERGGVVSTNYGPQTTHVLVPRGDTLEDFRKAMGRNTLEANVKIARIDLSVFKRVVLLPFPRSRYEYI